MTARQQVRTGSAAKAPETWSIETQRAPQVGEILQTARERKGIDLVRAERETKIRARHLVALESGDLDDLPAPVYAKGFLRNYSLYLGLDPDEMLSRWRREADRPRTAETVKVAPPPQPITAPRQGFKLTSGLVVAVVLSLIVAGFVGYVGLQLVRFSQNPEIAVSGPSMRRLNTGATTMSLGGTSAPNARVTATSAGEVVRTTTADAAGEWSMELPVAKSRNDFVITSLDLETGRESAGLEIIATVPVGTVQDPDGPALPVLPEGASIGTLAGTPSAEVLISRPKHNAPVHNGVLKLRGTSDSQTVLVSFQWLGAEERAQKPPDPVELEVVDGSFRGTFILPRGRWQVAAAGSNDGGPADVATTRVRVVYEAVVATVRAVGGQTRIQITADGELLTEPGELLREGEEATFRASDELIVQVGNAKAAHVMVDGVDHGAMGRAAGSRTWRFEPGQDPQPVP